MIGGVELKVCGITRLSDARFAVEQRADFLGFNFYEKSPRYISLSDFADLREDLPETRTVAVCVNPSLEQIAAYLAVGLDYVQIHFSQAETSSETVSGWSEAASREKLWLAPKIVPGEPFDERLLDYCDTFLSDGFKKDLYGGTGVTGDWEEFRERQERFSDRKWILAGGIGPENVVDAVRSTLAKCIDIASGVEESPGKKDPSKIRQVVESLRSIERRNF